MDEHLTIQRARGRCLQLVKSKPSKGTLFFTRENSHLIKECHTAGVKNNLQYQEKHKIQNLQQFQAKICCNWHLLITHCNNFRNRCAGPAHHEWLRKRSASANAHALLPSPTQIWSKGRRCCLAKHNTTLPKAPLICQSDPIWFMEVLPNFNLLAHVMYFTHYETSEVSKWWVGLSPASSLSRSCSSRSPAVAPRYSGTWGFDKVAIGVQPLAKQFSIQTLQLSVDKHG